MVCPAKRFFAGTAYFNKLDTAMNYRCTTFFFLVFFIIISIQPAYTSIHPDLLMSMNGLDDRGMIDVIIVVSGGIAPDRWREELKSLKSNTQRHALAMTRLQNAAVTAQASLIDYLDSLRNAGKASHIKSYWIMNAVKARLTTDEIYKISMRSDVLEIRSIPKVEPIAPVDDFPQISTDRHSAYAESKLVYVGADSAWKMGLTGRGRIVANYDISGVDGYHPALYNNWKGHDGDTMAAFYARDDTVMFPTAGYYHGTHTTGIMVGHDDITGDTVGIAPDARWIAAAVSNILDAYQWLADPDGNPNTTADVPDVINNSWGWTGDCLDWLWEAIDNTEAMGIVNIFSAGNEGGQSLSIRSPADRAVDSLNTFAVGAVHHVTGLITHFSSRGPSTCDSISIKPNIVAPGGEIRSCEPGGLYSVHGGTSMSAPHVAGAVAILRQYAPEATAEQIKNALLMGAAPTGEPYPNNAYGWGVLDVAGALQYLQDMLSPDLRMARFAYDTVNPGQEMTIHLSVTNHACDVDSVWMQFANDWPGLNVLTDSFYLGYIGYFDTVATDESVRIITDDTLFPGTVIRGTCHLHGARCYHKEVEFLIQSGFAPDSTYYTHQSENLRFTVSNFGQYGFGSGSIQPLGYGGFAYGDTSVNNLYEAALIFGRSPVHVSDGSTNPDDEFERDFRIGVGGEMVVSLPGQFADQETYSYFDDGYAANPIGVMIKQRTFSWNDFPDNHFVVLEYSFENQSGALLTDFYIGLYFDWMYYRWHDAYIEGHFSTGENLGYVFRNYTPTADSSWYRGVSVINFEGARSYRVFKRDIWNRHGFSDEAKFGFLSGGLVDTCLSAEFNQDIAHIIATGPFTLLPGESDTAVFTVIGANYLNHLRSSAIRARNKYFLATGLEDELAGTLPNQFYLAQNYPNPFNASTVIGYNLPYRTSVELSIYNILGRKVRTIVDEEKAAGLHTADWDGRDDSGLETASGLYFCRLKAGDCIQSEKMLLLK